MYLAEKRNKLSSANVKSENDSSAANAADQAGDSAYQSQVDFTNSVDFSLPAVKRKSLASRSFANNKNNKHSLDSVDLASSGYSSLLCSSSSVTLSPARRGTPKKRNHEQESDENAFLNSYHFVSPLKKRKKDPSDQNYNKLILKEKSSSENVIRSSTPVANSKAKRFAKYHSFQPVNNRRSGLFEKPQTLPSSTNVSFDCGNSFDFTNSFDLTNEHQDKDSNIPSNLEQLCTGSILPDIPEQSQTPTEDSSPVTLAQSQSCDSNASTSSNRTRFFCGRLKLNIMGKLHNNLALKKILSYCKDTDLLSLSHVSQNYRSMITTNKNLETRRQNYLKARRRNLENNVPRSQPTSLPKPLPLQSHNHSMQLRPKPKSPPVSPSRRSFYENQKIAQSHAGPFKKCPRCSKPAIISILKIRCSPRKRKKKNSILKISSGAGRVQKQTKTFLAKPSIDSQFTTDQLYVTFPTDRSNSASPSSIFSSPSSDDSGMSGNEAETYEFAECSGKLCNFKFCVKCNCKYHPRTVCKDFSPASPQRGHHNNRSNSVACSSKSFKSLKRLVY